MTAVMNPTDRIFVAGHRGLAGGAILRRLQRDGFHHLLTADRDQLDLRRQAEVEAWFDAHRPEHVFLAAARVGGIHANNSFRAEFLYDNLMIASNVIHAAWKFGVRKLLFLGSSCIYPKHCPQPMREESLLGGALEATNEPYAIAKIAGLKLCESYNRQYHTNFIALMPTNLYGPGDNFHPEHSHVLPALIRRFVEAREAQVPEVVVWGTGTPFREFLYVDDLADAALFAMQHYSDDLHLNVGTGQEIAIRDLATRIAERVGYTGRVTFDASKPDGTPRKLLDVQRLQALGWSAPTGLTEGLDQTIAWFHAHREAYRGR